ncbi:MAG: ATP-binding protein [Pseudomonadota bacterium]
MRNRKYILVFGLATLLLLLGALIVGFITARRMQEIIASDFNAQQLVLARHIAGRIGERIDSLKRAVSTLRFSPSIQYLERSWGNRMRITMLDMRDKGLIDIRLVRKDGKSCYGLTDKLATFAVNGSFGENDYFRWASQKENRGSVYVSRTFRGRAYPGKLLMLMAIPVYEESIDEAFPSPSGARSGVLCFTIDATRLVKEPLEGVKSGKTGYTWVIDSKGTFLYHPEETFIGKNAFEIREKREPKISFDKINYIQKEWMLKGKEGTSWYVSGWHRGVSGKIRKLIAYSPVFLASKHGDGNCFSVAVVAPEEEIQESIYAIYGRQFYIMVSIIAAIIFLGTYTIRFENRWAVELEREVREKTKGLEESTAKLKKSEEMYKSLVEGAEDLIFTMNTEGTYLSMNRYGFRVFGMTDPSELVGRTMYDLFSKESADLQMNFVREARQMGNSPGHKYPVEIGKKQYWFSSSFKNLTDQDGSSPYILGISRDITERKKAEEQMYQTEKLASVGKLAAGVAHEINNPIAIILGYSDHLLEKIEPNTKTYAILEIIERQGLNCKRIVENLMGFARIRETAEYSADINQSIERVMSVVQNTLLTNKITLVCNLAADLPRVRGDSGQLQQVFMNLVNNAASAMNGGGTITVATRLSETPNRVEVLFGDTGQGIEGRYRDKIFDPFFTTKKVGEGTGLGLSVSYGIIVNNYGGEIDFETVTGEENKEKHGTTFTISLPTVTEKEMGG